MQKQFDLTSSSSEQQLSNEIRYNPNIKIIESHH